MTTITELFASAVAARETEPALRTTDGTTAWTWGDYGRQAAAAVTEPAFLDRALEVRDGGATALTTIVCVGEACDETSSWDELVATPGDLAARRPGTVGKPLLGVEVRPSDAGEVLMRGPVIMRGYRNRPDAAAETIDADGWLHSGDVGAFDEDGYLRIVDRIKEIIINAAGKNMSPANIESTVKVAGSLIGNVCAIGDGRPYNVALVTLDPDSARGRNANDPEVVAEIEAQIARANERLARVEQIKRFAVLDEDWLPGGDELTPTSKLKRRVIADKYHDRIDALYV